MNSASSDGTRVIYVAGSARSGSTLLAALLGTHPDAVMVGELSNIGMVFERSGTCSCGRAVRECPFWSAVWGKLEKHPQWAEDGWRSFRSDRHRELLRMQMGSYLLGRTPTLDMILGMRLALYEAVSEVAGRSMVVDSSKKPITAAAMARDSRFHIDFLHIVRDPRAVSYSELTSRERWPDMPSWERPQDFSPTTSALAWNVVNASSELVDRVHFRGGSRIRYEDFCQRPIEVLADAMTMLGITGFDAPIAEGQLDLPLGHVVSGNPIRLRQGPRPIVDEQLWRTRLSGVDRRRVDMLTFPLRRHYGYH